MLRRSLLRLLATVLFVPFGLACFAAPVAQLALQDDWGIIDDTRAYFGAGTAETAFKVSRVSCVGERSGSSSSRGIGITQWDCAIDLEAVKAPAESKPAVGSSFAESAEEWNRQFTEQIAEWRSARSMSSRIERMLPTNRSGDLPTLRRLSGEGEPLRFGVIWSGGNLAWRWLAWLLVSAVIFGFGAACLFATRLVWRRV